MIGHMILRKNIDGDDILGLKIVGGKVVSSSKKGAVIEKVKRGSIADQEGHLKPGKTSNDDKYFSDPQPRAHLLVHSSVADVLCVLLKPFFFRVFSFKGDEVIEWNGRSLQGKSTQEVCDVIEESRHESQIELIVSRPLSVNRKAAQTFWRQSHSPIRAQTRQYLHKGSTHLIMTF